MAVTPDLVARGLGALPSQLGTFQSPRYRVFIRDHLFRRVAELTDWISFTCIPKFNDVGTWSLETSADSVEARLLDKTGGVIVTRETEGVERVVFSGFVWTEYGYTETRFRASGYSDEALLWTPARPTPSRASPPFPDAYDVRTGVASTVMHALVRENIGIEAPDGPRVDWLFVDDDPLLGSTITARANLQPLITLLAELAITPYAGGLGFKLRQDDVLANVISFGVYAPADRSAEAKFSVELGTAASYEDIESAPEANHVYVMSGDGFGDRRTIVEAIDSASVAEWGRRISTTVDMRSVTGLGELSQRAAEEIAKVSTLRRTAVVPFDVPSLQFGQDYDLGTLVTVVTPGGEVVDLIRQVEIDLDPEQGAVVTPIVGQGDGSDDERMATITRTIQGRLSNLERNWNVPDNSITNAMLYQTERWRVGDLKQTMRSTEQDGWKFCNGQAVSRTTYAALFAVIGVNFGPGDGATTFNLPDFRNRFPVGAGSSYALHERGGGTVDLAHSHTGAAHTHPGSHSHGTVAHTHTGAAHTHSHSHTGAAHTHPGSHSHGIGSHTHTMNHAHPFTVTGLETGLRNNDSVGAFGFDEPNVSSGTEDHHHNVDTYNSNTDNSSQANTGASSGSTDSDSNAPAASYSGSTGADATAASFSGQTGSASPNTESDSNAHAASYSGQSGASLGSTPIVPAYVGVNWEIYAGA